MNTPKCDTQICSNLNPEYKFSICGTRGISVVAVDEIPNRVTEDSEETASVCVCAAAEEW